LVRVRKKASTLWLPTLVLSAASFSVSYFAYQVALPTFELILIAAAAVTVLFWLLPLLGYLFSYLEISNQRLINRYGFLGMRKQQADFLDISAIEIQRTRTFGSKVLVITLVDGGELVINGYAKTKLLASEIERLALGTL
jgi:membrane protein YdbS with pleckstrin-like domain